MPLVQTDLFGWVKARVRDVERVKTTDAPITVEDLSDSLIKYFGHWIQGSHRLLQDDSTVCETLILIYRRYTREQLQAVYKTETWFSAWERFNKFYLTTRTEGGYFFGDWLKGRSD